MSVTRAQLVARTRELMDATGSQRWDDSFIKIVLGVVHGGEWQGILGANPYHRFAQRSVTANSSGLVAYSALDSGSADSLETFYRILAITDGNGVVYRQVGFMEIPTATTSQVAQSADGLWYDAGQNIQIIPASGISLTVTVNHVPTRVDQLSADDVAPEFPSGHESVLWLEAAAYLLSKGGAENEAAQTMRAMAEVERQSMYQELSRRGASPHFLLFPDRAAEWGA